MKFVQFSIQLCTLLPFLLILRSSAQNFRPDPFVDGLLTLWMFNEPSGPRVSVGAYNYSLHEDGGPIKRVNEGVFDNFSSYLVPNHRFIAPRATIPALNFHGRANLTVISWIKRMPYCGFPNYTNPHPCCEFIAGVFNESASRRQYGLFLNLHSYNSSGQTDGLVSDNGGDTPGHSGCVTGSYGATKVPYFRWSCVGMTYDGRWVRSYYNGRLDARPGLNPFPYDKGIFDGGQHGADFTVGGNNAFGEKHNYFYGLMGGLAIYNETLSDDVVKRVCGYVL